MEGILCILQLFLENVDLPLHVESLLLALHHIIANKSKHSKHWQYFVLINIVINWIIILTYYHNFQPLHGSISHFPVQFPSLWFSSAGENYYKNGRRLKTLLKKALHLHRVGILPIPSEKNQSDKDCWRRRTERKQTYLGYKHFSNQESKCMGKMTKVRKNRTGTNNSKACRSNQRIRLPFLLLFLYPSRLHRFWRRKSAWLRLSTRGHRVQDQSFCS